MATQAVISEDKESTSHRRSLADMDQAIQQAVGDSAPVLFNQRQSVEQEITSLAVADLLPSPNDLSGAAFSGFNEVPDAGIPPAFSGWEEAPGASLPLNTEWFPDAGLPFANMGFVHPPGPAYTDSEQCLYANLSSSPTCDQNFAAFSGSEEVPGASPASSLAHVSHPSQFNEHSLSQPQLENDANYLAPAISNSRRRRCIRCRKVEQKCIIRTSNGEPRCLQCVIHNIPASLCGQSYDIRQIKPFSKCLEIKHKSLFTCIQSQRTAQLRHYRNGPILDVECFEFRVTDETDITQISVLRKNLSGWNWMYTTAYCVADPQVKISLYLPKCVRFSIDEACGRHQYPTSFFFKQARVYEDVPIIQQCFKMYTALRLLRIGWQFSSNESLEMLTVESKGSIFHGFKCVPGMVQKQLNYALELEMMKLDEKILTGAWNIMRGERREWPIGFLALVLLLHIREVDAGRLIYWSRFYHELNEFWYYLSKPTALIDKTIASCNSILSHFHCLWRQPLHLNWNEQKSKDTVDNDPKAVNTIKELQTYMGKLRNDRLVGRKACDLYKAGNPNSVDFTVSSLLLESLERGCEVKGFS